MKKTLLIDFSRCIECRACEVACEREHGRSHIFVFEFEGMITMVFHCKHCEKALCIEACPANALYRDKEGAVLVAPKKCIGCMMCAIVCPFGIPELDSVNKTMSKCNLCAHRRAEGKEPACVTTCPTDALLYGSCREIIRKRKTMELGKESKKAPGLAFV